MKQFLKDNAVLVAGVILPLALIAVSLIAGAVSRASVPDPRYDMVFAGSYNKERWQIGLDKGDLTIRCIEPDKPDNKCPPYSAPSLYRFDHQTMTVTPLSINYRHIVDGVVQDPVIDELNTHLLSAATLSPDGYQLIQRSRYGDGLFQDILFGELFGSDNRNTHNLLHKDGRNIPLLGLTYRYEDAVPIAWVEGKKP